VTVTLARGDVVVIDEHTFDFTIPYRSLEAEAEAEALEEEEEEEESEEGVGVGSEEESAGLARDGGSCARAGGGLVTHSQSQRARRERREEERGEEAAWRLLEATAGDLVRHEYTWLKMCAPFWSAVVLSSADRCLPRVCVRAVCVCVCVCVSAFVSARGKRHRRVRACMH
jgi:hypothetical protein